MRGARAVVGSCIAAGLLVGCGGSGSAATAGATTSGGAATNASNAAADLPAVVYDFDRVCETQVGFAGAAAYDATAGIHPVVLFTDHGDPPTLIQSSVTLPAGWAVTYDGDLSSVQLVACSRRVEATPNGTMCDFDPSDGSSPSTLALTDTAYELTVYAAATGERVGDPQRLEASSTRCPMFAMIREGDTKYLNNPTDDQYTNALKGVVSP